MWRAVESSELGIRGRYRASSALGRRMQALTPCRLRRHLSAGSRARVRRREDHLKLLQTNILHGPDTCPN